MLLGAQARFNTYSHQTHHITCLNCRQTAPQSCLRACALPQGQQLVLALRACAACHSLCPQSHPPPPLL